MEAIEIIDRTALEFDEFGSMKLFDFARALFLKLTDSDQLAPRRNQVVIGHRKPVLINLNAYSLKGNCFGTYQSTAPRVL